MTISFQNISVFLQKVLFRQNENRNGPKGFLTMDIFAEHSVRMSVPVSLSLLFLSAVAHSPSFIPPCLLVFCLLPPVSLFLPTLPTASPLFASAQLCYPTPTVLSPSVFLPPNLLFVLRRLQHGLVMFFFLRSHFRTSEGDQEKIGLRKPAVKGSSTPFALQISAQHCETFRPSSSLSEKQVVSRSTCLVSPFDASTPTATAACSQPSKSGAS